MKITRIVVEWEDGRRDSIEELEVTQYLRAGGNKESSLYLLLALALRLTEGFS